MVGQVDDGSRAERFESAHSVVRLRDFKCELVDGIGTHYVSAKEIVVARGARVIGSWTRRFLGWRT